jgi:hypothetical protein
MGRRAWHLQFGSVKRIVASPILVVLAQARAHFEPELRRHCHVPGIKQAVEVCPEQQPVSNVVGTVLGVRTDVGSLKRRQRAFSRYCAGPAVCIENCYAECRLPKPRLYEARASVAPATLYRQRESGSWHGQGKGRGLCQTGLPDASSLASCEIVLDGCLCPWPPVCWLGNPRTRREEGGRDELNATNLVRSGPLVVSDTCPDARDSRAHFVEGRASVAEAERLPREPIWEPRKLREVSKPADRVMRGTKLEQKR